MMRGKLALLIALSVIVANGCATYSPMPLNHEAVERALSMPSADELRDRLAALHHPLIHSEAFDPSSPLTPEQAAVLAVVMNPTLRAERNKTAVADAQLLQAGIQ